MTILLSVVFFGEGGPRRASKLKLNGRGTVGAGRAGDFGGTVFEGDLGGSGFLVVWLVLAGGGAEVELVEGGALGAGGASVNIDPEEKIEVLGAAVRLDEVPTVDSDEFACPATLARGAFCADCVNTRGLVEVEDVNAGRGKAVPSPCNLCAGGPVDILPPAGLF